MQRRHWIDLVAVITSGLMAGLFFAYEVSIVPAFAKLNDDTYLLSFQEINKAIQNPIFIPVFIVAPVAMVLAVAARWKSPPSRQRTMLIVAVAIYVVGSVIVTAAGNIPLNNRLDKFDVVAASGHQLAHFRDSFEMPWNVWNTVRTIASVVAFALLVVNLRETRDLTD